MPAPLFAYQHRADGLLTQVTANSQNHGFGYADSGLLTTRTNPFRTLSIDSRDPVGRILQQTTTVGGGAAMVEAMTWRGDGTLNTYSVTRSGTGAWNESRAYGYNSRGQLLSEGFSPAAGLSDTLTYVFDGSTTRLGVRTDAKAGTGAPGAWEASATAIDTLARVTQDQINAPRRVLTASGLARGADHVDVLVDGVSQGRAVHPGWADPVGTWSMNLNPAAGAHTLTVNAVHPSHQYTATASSTFTIAQSQGGNVTVTSAYDAEGDVTSRTWDSGLAQTLTWDAFGRLIKVAQRDSASNGYDWSAVYDGLGRRLKTTQQTVTANAASGAATVTTSIYDPQVEFLEIGVAVNGAKAWKVYGPDLNGRYGSLQGTGGLEAAIVQSSGATKDVLNDLFGNGVASVAGGTVSWFTTRVGAYGPLPGSQVETLTDITQVAEATAWRSRRIDSTGFIYLGARYYEPTSGRFLSADPMGHGASPSLYDFAGGDPVNYFDPDGRLGKDPNNTQKPWEPNKTDCDELRSKYLDYFAHPNGGYPYVDADRAIVAATIAAAVETSRYEWEHTSTIYESRGNIFFTSPRRTKGDLPAGGGMVVDNPAGTTLVALTHGHNIGWKMWAWSVWQRTGEPPDNAEQQYLRINEFFSVSDQAASQSKRVPIYVFTFSGDIRSYNAAIYGSPTVPMHPGDRLQTAPSKADALKIMECLQKGF